ncbi:MAG: transporter substrate-binding protein [Massilia sp.]|nr:transporter substrate-binding protein [Massilia sp.]
MHFSQMNDGKSTKVTKIAAVAIFHVILAMLLIKSMNSRSISMPHMPEEVVLLFTPEAPPPPPPEPPKPKHQVAPPQIVAPPPEVEVTQPPPPDAVAAVVSTEPAPQQPAAPAQPEATAAPASPNSGVMHTAVLADANGCAKPDYPAKAARDGVSGTVTLALLVGTDGRVAGSRVQSSSGSRELDKAAIAALSMCKFKPATNGGVAEQAWGQIAYVWTLD